ncbi:hypothetical protein, partial [Desulfosarcina cetonica]
LAKDQIRDKDQKRDGSCLLPEDGAVESHGGLTLAYGDETNGKGDGIRDRDGSCMDPVTESHGLLIFS